MSNDKIYFDKKQLAKYIVDEHFSKKGSIISPLKLQKTLYLLYAMWGGNVILINQEIKNNSDTIEYSEKLNEDLFVADFEAWRYGPVDRDIYIEFKNNKTIYGDDIDFSEVEEASILKPFIDSILNQTYDISDFSLVDLTHKDKSWIEKADEAGKMDNEQIKREYANRFKLERQ